MWNLQGISNDSSDDEWESSIRLDYGERGSGMLREAAIQVDAGLDIVGLVNHSFHQYDVLSDAAATNFGGSGLPSRVATTAIYEDVAFFEAADPEDGFYDGFDHGNTCPNDEDYTIPGDNVQEGPVLNAGRSTLQQSAQTLLFAGLRLSSLTATLLLLNLCRTHQCSNLFITELLTILSLSMLPKINTLPRSKYLASKIL
jgi:hypothetical protein